MIKFIFLETLACTSLLLAACTANDPERDATNIAAQENDAAGADQAIRLANERWLELIRAKDAAAIGQMYAQDGALMPPNGPIAKGPEAIRSSWQSMMQIPGFSLTFEPEAIVVSSSGDMALDRGTYDLAMNSPSGPIQDKGKYVVVWRKLGGEWKVAADIFNSDKPSS